MAFAESLRYASVFDKIWPFAVHVPLNSLAINILSAFSAGSVNEGNAKPATQLSLTSNSVLPVKVAGFVAATSELLSFGNPATIQLFDSALRQAIIITCNTRLLVDLVALTTPIPSAGGTAANILSDLTALLAAIPVGENSRLFIVLSGDDAKALLTKVNAAGVLAFPKVNLATGGEVLPGIGLIISNALPAGTALMLDASGLLLGDEGITLDNSRQASLQLESAPDNPTTSSTVLLSLWSRNMMALRAERSFAFALGRPNALASLSGVNY